MLSIPPHTPEQISPGSGFSSLRASNHLLREKFRLFSEVKRVVVCVSKLSEFYVLF